jgi:hypothetical protein
VKPAAEYNIPIYRPNPFRDTVIGTVAWALAGPLGLYVKRKRTKNLPISWRHAIRGSRQEASAEASVEPKDETDRESSKLRGLGSI